MGEFLMLEFKGGCHCGNISVIYKTTIPAEDAVPRACQCSFCRKHATRGLSDPMGEIAITVTDPARLGRYQFGTKATEFLVCSTCGVYVSAYMPDGDRAYANVMANVLHDHEAFGPGVAADYGSEDEAGKRQRRRQNWTPATLTIKTQD
jgi:hypothetical protein